MDVQELTSCILQFSTATIFDEIKLQSSVLGQPGPNSPTQVSYIFDEGPIYQGHSTETWDNQARSLKPWFGSLIWSLNWDVVKFLCQRLLYRIIHTG